MRDYKIDKNEVLRYLGHKTQNINEDLENKINTLLKYCLEISKPQYIYAFFDVETLDSGIKLNKTNLLFRGNDIFDHLKGAEKCGIIAATLGAQTEKEIILLEKRSMTDAIIFDSACSSLIENVVSRCEEEMISIVQKEGKFANYRYSPGYGDFPIETQKELISVLNAEKRIGLTVTDSFLMIPRKSVTAVFGVFSEEKSDNQKGCEACSFNKDCKVRK